MVGVSRQPLHYSRLVMRELLQRGFTIYPVNPYAQEMEGLSCSANVKEIQPIPEAAIILAPVSESLSVLRECAAAGIGKVWIRHPLHAKEQAEARVLCTQMGITLIEGECPLMHLSKPGFIHRVHRFVHVNLGGMH